jgi:hypothetical protein
MTTTLHHHPPELLQLERALTLTAGDPLLTALHLALPVGEPASCSVRLSRRELRWRDVGVSRSGDAATDALLLAQLGQRAGDQFFTLSETDPARWVKILASGRRDVVYGSVCLLGLPPVVADRGLAPEAVTATLLSLCAGHVAPGQCSETGVEVRGSRRLITLHQGPDPRRG